MGLYSRYRKAKDKQAIADAEARYEKELRGAEDELEDELEGGSAAVRAAREKMRKAREAAAEREDDDAPPADGKRSL